ncbi:MAG TPA: glycosyltransferase, partial [Terriglobales bacterium]
MKLLFWISVGVIAYTYAGYPLLIWILSRLRQKPWTKAPITPSVSIVMAVHNGAAILARKLDHLRDLDYPNIAEVIVVSDGSTDATNDLLTHRRDPKLHAIFLREQVGKASALNAAVAAATGEIILFVDVRPWIGEGAIAHLVSNFADPSIGCVAGDLIVRQDGNEASAAALGGLYWRYEQGLRDCEARFHSPLGVYGGFYAIRRSAACEFPAGTILDDMYQPLSIVRSGLRSVLELDAKVYDTWPKKSADEFRRKVRTLAGNFQLIQVAPWLLTPRNPLLVQ